MGIVPRTAITTEIDAKGRDQMWDTIPARMMSVEDAWNSATGRWHLIGKGYAIAFTAWAIAILLFLKLPHTMPTLTIILIFTIIGGIGIGLARVYTWVYKIVDKKGSILMWPDWNQWEGEDKG